MGITCLNKETLVNQLGLTKRTANSVTVTTMQRPGLNMARGFFHVPVDINLSFSLPCFLLGVLFWYGLEGEVESRKRAYGGAREPFGGGQRGRG